jgi:hypothetical protein
MCFARMNSSGAAIDKAEWIKWWDVLSDVVDFGEPMEDEDEDFIPEPDVMKALDRARECQHPDAQWLVSLFPTGVHVTPERERGDAGARGRSSCALAGVARGV